MAELVLKNCKIGEEINDITIKDGVISKVGKTDVDGTDVGGKRRIRQTCSYQRYIQHYL